MGYITKHKLSVIFSLKRVGEQLANQALKDNVTFFFIEA